MATRFAIDCSMAMAGSPKFPQKPLPPRTCSFGPGRTGRNSPCRSARRGHGYGNGRGFFNWTFEAQSHGPTTRCLRFAPMRCRPARKTRFRPRDCALPGGACTHWASQGKVSAMCQFHISFFFRELAGRNPDFVPLIPEEEAVVEDEWID